MSVAAIWLWLGVASAAPGYYHPADVAAASEQFKRAQATSGATFQSLQARSDALAVGIVQFETALDLLGSRASADQRARQRELQRRYQREQAVVAGFANQQMDTFGTLFESALHRATAGQGWVSCHVEDAPSLRVGPGFSRGTPASCEGTDQNAAIAAKMDADPVLARALDGLIAQAWPGFTLAAEPVPAIGGGSASVRLLALMTLGAGDALAAIDEADEDARLGFQSAIEEGASTAAREAMLTAAREVTARTATRRASASLSVIQTLDKLRKKLPKLGIAADFGWCAQPEILGGCTPTAVSQDAIVKLAEHPAVAAALLRANGFRP